MTTTNKKSPEVNDLWKDERGRDVLIIKIWPYSNKESICDCIEVNNGSLSVKRIPMMFFKNFKYQGKYQINIEKKG